MMSVYDDRASSDELLRVLLYAACLCISPGCYCYMLHCCTKLLGWSMWLAAVELRCIVADLYHYS